MSTLVAEAPEDPVDPPPHGQHLAADIGPARLVTVPGTGHALGRSVPGPPADAVLKHVRPVGAAERWRAARRPRHTVPPGRSALWTERAREAGRPAVEDTPRRPAPPRQDTMNAVLALYATAIVLSALLLAVVTAAGIVTGLRRRRTPARRTGFPFGE